MEKLTKIPMDRHRKRDREVGLVLRGREMEVECGKRFDINTQEVSSLLAKDS